MKHSHVVVHSWSLPERIRQEGKHQRNWQLTLPCSTDGASGHHHSESCQERWQSKSSSFTVKETQFSYQATRVVITQFQLTSSRLACLLHSKRLCNLFKCEMTLFYWYWHVRVCSFGRFHCEDGAPSILPLFLFYSSLFLNRHSHIAHLSPSRVLYLCWGWHFQTFYLWKYLKA